MRDLLFKIFCPALLAAPALAQWSTDSALNFAIGDAASDQNQPLVAPAPDGGVWVSWFDGIGTGWDVRVQKLDADGNEVFPHNGILVADRSFSSTQGYGLDTEASGGALLVFRDDSQGGTQITAARVTPSGVLVWGPNGIQLTNTSSFVANPKIAGTSSGDAVVAWTEGNEVKLQKLLPNGGTGWGAGVTLTPAAGSYSTADLHGAGNDAILSIVHQTGGFTSPKHLRAQKFDGTNGAALWGATPLAVFDGGSLQFGNFPPFTPDGADGAVFSWYSSSPSLQCFVQRVNSAGTELYSHNGVAVASTPGQIRVNPSAAYDATGDDVYVFWTEQNGSQSQDGVSGQRIDNTGALMWGAAGATLVPLGSTDVGLVQTVAAGPADGALAFWSEAPAFGQDRLYGSVLERDGTIAANRFDVASTVSGKARLAAAKSQSTSGYAILAWSDARTDGGDIYVQNVQTDGALGGGSTTGFPFCFGDGGSSPGCTDCPCGNNAPPGSAGGCLNSSGTSAVLAATGAPSLAADSLRFEAVNAVPTTFAILFSGTAALPANLMNPCFGQNSGVLSPVLDGLRCAGQGVIRHGTRPTDANGDVGVTTNGWGPPNGPAGGLVANTPAVAGQELYFQCFYRESGAAGCATGQNTTNGVWVVVQP